MNTTLFQWDEVEREAKELAKKILNEQIKFTISANNIKKNTPEWYLLDGLRQRIYGIL